jgi:hypothetical protein
MRKTQRCLLMQLTQEGRRALSSGYVSLLFNKTVSTESAALAWKHFAGTYLRNVPCLPHVSIT